MSVQSFLHAVDEVSTLVGKLFSWLIVVLMTVVCVEVFKRYILNAPTAWIFDAEQKAMDAQKMRMVSGNCHSSTRWDEK